MVKIISGFSEKGGSTMAFIRLTNLLNDNGIDCTFYGPHEWHRDKCKSGLIQNAFLNENDIAICHFLPIKRKPNCKKVILSLHEKNLYPISEMKQYWDVVVFLNEKHREYHNKYTGEFVIIPNFKDQSLEIRNKSLEVKNIAGVIGSIDRNKQTHISIQRALNDNCEFVYVFGTINDTAYYNEIKHYFDNPKVIHKGFSGNKQDMYDSVGKVYHSSISECACLVKDECYLTGTEFNGNDATSPEVSSMSNDEILNLWKGVLGL